MNYNGKRVAIIGSRTFNDKEKLYNILTRNISKIKLIVSGGAKGADQIGVEWASNYGIPYLVFPALWHDPFTGEYNKGAGFKRNHLIVKHSDVIIAFWDGESKGTAYTIDIARQQKKPVKIIKFTPPVMVPEEEVFPKNS